VRPQVIADSIAPLLGKVLIVSISPDAACMLFDVESRPGVSRDDVGYLGELFARTGPKRGLPVKSTSDTAGSNLEAGATAAPRVSPETTAGSRLAAESGENEESAKYRHIAHAIYCEERYRRTTSDSVSPPKSSSRPLLRTFVPNGLRQQGRPRRRMVGASNCSCIWLEKTKMYLVSLVLMLIVLMVALHLIHKYVPVSSSAKTILNVIVVVALCVWLLKAAGVWGT
jgi:hypothetical protein